MSDDYYSEEIHKKLVEWMQKEIRVMRELLSNMLEEELALMMWDEQNWNKVIGDRAELVHQLKALHLEPKVDDYENFYDRFYVEEDFELDILKTQLIAVTEKMTYQNMRNQQLFKNYGANLGKPLPENWHQNLNPATKRKIRVTTIEE